MDSEPLGQINLEAKRSSRTYRSFKEYAEMFGYSGKEHELAGKTILDVGAGDSDFAKEAEKYGAKVISLDSDYKNEKPGHDGQAVAAIAQKLPFADGSFDEVISSHAMWWMRTGRIDAIQEMFRVTKDGGKIKIAPAVFDFKGSIKPPYTEYKTHLDNPEIPGSLVINKMPGLTKEEWNKTLQKAEPFIEKAWFL